MLTIGFPCREYTTFERIIRISLTFNYNILLICVPKLGYYVYKECDFLSNYYKISVEFIRNSPLSIYFLILY